MTIGLLTRYEDEATPPSPDLSSDYRLQWCMTGMLEGEQYLRNQPMYEKQGQTREYLLGIKDTLRGALGLSDITVNELWRVYNLLAGDWTDINPIWRYESKNAQDQRSARIHSTIATINYTQSGSDGQVAMMTRQALEAGSGVLQVMWDREIGDLRLKSCTPDDVLPIRATDPDSFQGCLAVAHRREVTVNYARQLFPQHADYIRADRDASITGWGMKHRDVLRNRIASVSAFDIVDTQNAIPTQKLGAMPVVDLFYMYIDDQSINESRTDTIMMGDWDVDKMGKPFARNYWSYTVAPGKKRYPTKRLIVFTRKCVLYDGPSPYWHDMFPFVKFTPDPYPGIWYGISPLWAALPIQRSMDKIYRALDDHVQKILRPPVKGDKNSVSDPELRKIDPRMAGQRWRQNPHGKGVEILEIPPMDPMVMEYLALLKDRMEDITGVKSLTQAFGLAEAGQIPEGETVEKLMRFVSTQNRSRSRQLERAQTEIGIMQAYNIGEFYDEKRRFAVLGTDGVTPQDFDFDPNSLIPAYTNGDYKEDGVIDGGRVLDPRPRMDRARDYYKYRFSLYVKPGTLMESAGQNQKMMYMLLRSKGDLDLYTTLDKLGVDNIGPEPKGNVYERTMAEKQLTEMAAAGQIGGGGPPGAGGPPPPPGGPPSGPPPAGGAGPSSSEGRPHSMQTPPHIEGSNSNKPKMSTS